MSLTLTSLTLMSIILMSLTLNVTHSRVTLSHVTHSHVTHSVLSLHSGCGNLPGSACILQSKSSLEMMESQSCDAEPPPPPKPELRYPGLSRANTEGTRVL